MNVAMITLVQLIDGNDSRPAVQRTFRFRLLWYSGLESSKRYSGANFMNDDIRSSRRADLIARIAVAMPALTVKKVRRITNGQNNEVLVVNNDWIFRFPRTWMGAQALAHESTVLRHLHGRLPVDTPHPEVLNFPPGREAEWFMAYPLIPGRPLTRSRISRLSAIHLHTLADHLAHFLDALHSQAIPQECRRMLNVIEPSQSCSDLLARIQHHLYPLMLPEARDRVEFHFSQFLHRKNGWRLPQVLIHGDFGASNILTKEGPTVNAIIDWGSVAIGDPAIDYAAASTLHPRMLEFMQASHPKIGPLLDRAAFYRGTFALQEALFGAEHGDAAALKSGLCEYVR